MRGPKQLSKDDLVKVTTRVVMLGMDRKQGCDCIHCHLNRVPTGPSACFSFSLHLLSQPKPVQHGPAQPCPGARPNYTRQTERKYRLPSPTPLGLPALSVPLQKCGVLYSRPYMSTYSLDYFLDVYLINSDMFKYLSPDFSFKQQVHCLKVSHLRNKSEDQEPMTGIR